RQGVAEVLGAWAFGRADAEEQHFDLAIERRWLGERAAADRLHVQRVVPPSEAAAIPTETADVGELVEIDQRRRERLRAAHRQPRHRAIVLAGAYAIGALDYRQEVGEHHLRVRGTAQWTAGAAARRAGSGSATTR